MGLGGVACPKPVSRKRLKGRKDRAEAAVVQTVRAQCVVRDGFCRIGRGVQPGDEFGVCIGVSEWCHLGDHKRFDPKNALPTDIIDEVAAVNDSMPHKSARIRKLRMLRWLRWRLKSSGMPGFERAKP